MTTWTASSPKSCSASPSDREADRMAHLCVREKQIETEREVVMNERRYRVDDDVDGFLSEELFRLAFRSEGGPHGPPVRAREADRDRARGGHERAPLPRR